MDPFIQVYNDTEEQLKQLQQILRRKPLTASQDEVREIVHDIEETIVDLKDSIEVVKAEQSLPIDDINGRQNSISNLEIKLSECKQLINGSTSTNANRDSLDIDLETGQLPHEQDAVQEQLLREQDNQLDVIHQTMQNLHLQASTMGNELSDQGLMLEEMDGHMDTVVNKLSRGRRQLEWVYENNKEKLNDCCIGLLIAVLIVLLVLAFIL